MENNFWINHSSDYTEMLHTSLKNVMHPNIVKIVNKANPLKYLDYGCGDGRMTEMIDMNILISIFDISEEMLEQAEKRLGSRIECAYRNVNNIPKNYFDVIVSSLVFVCIDNDQDFTTAMQTISDSLTSNGKAIIGLTHPCFRQYHFSDFFTEFSKNKTFNYHRKGEPFEVVIHDEAKNLSVSFKDYHWPLGYTINKIIQSGLIIEQIIETYDDESVKGFNEQYPPFIILIANKK